MYAQTNPGQVERGGDRAFIIAVSDSLASDRPMTASPLRRVVLVVSPSLQSREGDTGARSQTPFRLTLRYSCRFT
jgi:hypothetical protein